MRESKLQIANLRFQISNSFCILQFLVAAATGISCATTPVPCHAEATMLVVVGAEGAPEYGRQFASWAERWRAIARQADAKLLEVGTQATGTSDDRDRLKLLLDDESKDATNELWLIMIGHGTWDGRAARFNLRGPDIADTELADMLSPFSRPLVVIDSSASSGPFINRLSAPGRIVVTATRSGNEHNFARFGEYFGAALIDSAADYDRDGQISLLEAFLASSRRVAEFYRTAARLATEHPLIDDNGDGLGTPGDWFRGLRAVKRARDGADLDGHRARQCVLIRSDRERRIPIELRAERDRLELEVAQLRDRKESFADEDEYYRHLEEILVKLAHMHEQIERAIGSEVEGS
jgi:hypothetical protein